MGSSLRSVCESYWLETQPDGYPLGDWVADQRDEPDVVPWRSISYELHSRTGGVIDLPPQTLLNWYGDRDREAVA